MVERMLTIKEKTNKDSPIYSQWKSMRNRCNNPNHEQFKDYGGRGIKICKEWDDFKVCENWAFNNGYKDGLTIDRKDNDEGYYPENCKWSTRLEQNNNQRSNVILTYKGESKTLSQWARHLGISYRTIHHRYRRGWTIEEIMTTPQGSRRDKPSPKSLWFNYRGKKKTLKQLSEISGIKTATILHRIQKQGMNAEEASKRKLMKNQFG